MYVQKEEIVEFIEIYEKLSFEQQMQVIDVINQLKNDSEKLR